MDACRKHGAILKVAEYHNAPIHPSKMEERLTDLFKWGNPFFTMSSDVVSCIGMMVKQERIALPIRFLVQDEDDWRTIHMAQDGELVEIWPYEDGLNILEAAFHFRYCDNKETA
jgi:hypothetical protein